MEEQENQIENQNSNSQIHRSDVKNEIIDDGSNLQIDSELDNDSKSTLDCIFRIAFNDEARFNELKEGIIRSLSTYFSTKKMDVDFLEDTNFLHISVIKKLKTEDIPLFMISIDACPKITSQTESVPSYRRCTKDVLDCLCFNCAGRHALKDCPEPRNQRKIDKARKEFMEKNERCVIDDVPLFRISIDASSKITQTESIPSYRRAVKDVLDFGKLGETNEHCERPKTYLCFNCSGSHALKDCPEPRNQQKINKARKQYMTKNERYHIDVDQRLAHLKPGKLTNNLKNALGLKSKELPPFFYRMRILGYPPGWLEDSKIANSGITLIDSEENAILTSDNEERNSEQGEYKYDSSKIISFPGFNVDPGSGYYDDYKYHNVPAMHSLQKKEMFMQTLSGNLTKPGYKRKKMNIQTNKPEMKAPIDFVCEKEIASKIARLNNQTEFEIKSLSVDPIEQPLNINCLKHPNHEELKTKETTETKTNSRSSPSLADLEAQQIKLLEALQKSSCSIVSEDSVIDENNLKINNEEISIGEYSTVIEKTLSICEENKDLESTLNVLPSNKKISVLGTPVLKFSKFDQLPNGENFKEGVSDVINFENLPDSTGKYEEMKIVLNKIRMKISKLNNQEN